MKTSGPMIKWTSWLVLLAAALAPIGAQSPAIAIVGGTVYPVSGPRVENATVVIQDGRIAAVGANVAVPAGAQRIEAAGKWVTPGLINVVSVLGLVEVSLSAGATDNTARTSPPRSGRGRRSMPPHRTGPQPATTASRPSACGRRATSSPDSTL